MIGLDSNDTPIVREGTKLVSRDEWLEMAKRRANDLIRDGKYAEAYHQFAMDLRYHPAISKDLATLGRVLDGFTKLRNGELCSREQMRAWIATFL